MTIGLTIANGYGNVDVRARLSKRYAHIEGERLQPLCRKLGIKYAQALVGFEERGRKARFGYQPIFKGVVAAARSAPKLLSAIQDREKRANARPKKTPEQLAAERKRRHQREIAAFVAAIKGQFPVCPDNEARSIAVHACQVGSGRVGRTSTLGFDEKVHLAVVAHIRHCHTDYEQMLDDFGDEDARQDARQYARESVSGQIDAVLEQWQNGPDREIAMHAPPAEDGLRQALSIGG